MGGRVVAAAIPRAALAQNVNDSGRDAPVSGSRPRPMSHKMLPNRRLAADALILESLGVALMAVDEGCRITRFNALAEQLTGARRDTVFGQPCHEVLQASSCDVGCPLRERCFSHRRTARPLPWT
jgi:PAS domain-containing protein